MIHACPSKLQSQHSAENLAEIKGKLEGKPLLYGNVNVIKGKESLVGLAVGDNNSNLTIAPPIVVGAWPMAVSLWQHVECLLLLHMPYFGVHIFGRKFLFLVSAAFMVIIIYSLHPNFICNVLAAWKAGYLS